MKTGVKVKKREIILIVSLRNIFKNEKLSDSVTTTKNIDIKFKGLSLGWSNCYDVKVCR